MPRVKSILELDAPGVQLQDAARLVDSRPEILTEAALAALESPPGSGLYPSLKNRRVVVTDMDEAAEVYGQNVPDYANMETTNRITASDGRWVVDRTGFVNCESYVHASNNLASGVYMEASIYINNIMMSTNSTKNAPENTTRTQTAAVLPVSRGDIIWIVASAYDSMNNFAAVTDNIYSTIRCRFIPPKFVSTAAPRITADPLNMVPVPDYANAETTDKIALVTTGDGVSNTQNGAWVADRTGWLRVGIQIPTVTAGSSGWAYYACRVDGVVAAAQSLSPEPMSTSGSGWNWESLVPVQAGQSVSLQIQSSYVNTKSICIFIPPKFVTVQAPNIVVSGASYSEQEVATGETWIDGKPIYRRAFTGAITSAADAASFLLLADGFDSVVRSGGWLRARPDGAKVSLGHYLLGDLIVSSTVGVQASSNKLFLQSRSNYERTGGNSDYQIWVEYTKV